MPFTLSQARQKLYRYVTPTLDACLVTDRINSALERIYNSGKWKGLMTTVGFNNLLNENWFPDTDVQYLTLPRQYQSISGIQFGAPGLPAIPRLVFPRWQEYIAGGNGQLSPGTSMEMAVDMGDGYPVYTDPTKPFYIRFETTNSSDTALTINVVGLDSNGNDVFDTNGNSYVTVPLNTTLTSITWGKIVEIHKPISAGTINFFAVNPNDTTQQNLIADYEATETIPSYKRYKLGASEFSARINCLCKRRYVELVNGPDDETTIVPGNEGALKLTLMALQYEDKNDLERAEEYFNKAIGLLNAELKEDMGNPVLTLQMNPIAAAMSIPARY
jgi:hypothetical protein